MIDVMQRATVRAGVLGYRSARELIRSTYDDRLAVRSMTQRIERGLRTKAAILEASEVFGVTAEFWLTKDESTWRRIAFTGGSEGGEDAVHK